jgi:hypothetical protein
LIDEREAGDAWSEGGRSTSPSPEEVVARAKASPQAEREELCR